MQVRPRHAARGAHAAYHLAPLHALALLDHDLGKMTVEGEVAAAVGDLNEVSVTAGHACENNPARGRGENRFAVLGLEIHSLVQTGFPRDGVGTVAETRSPALP